MFELLRFDAGRVKTHTEACLALAAQHDVKQWQIMVPVLLNWAISRVAGPTANLGEFRRAVATCRADGLRTVSTSNLWLLAQAEAEAGETETALATIATALADLDGVHFWDAEIHRARGEILLKRDPADTAAAEEAFRTAIAVAQQQKTRSFKLRAALSLAKLYQSTGRPLEAHAALAPALEGFSPTPEFPEIEEAEALVGALPS